MSDWLNLNSATSYLTLLSQINDRDRDAGFAFDPASTSVTNPFNGMVRFNSANKRWEKYNGSVWAQLIDSATDAFAMTVSGLRGGSIAGTISATGATVSGGSWDVSTLKRGGSDVWSVATLTNLNQLSNGPGYLVASALTPYALLASANFTVLQISGASVATQGYVTSLGYATAASVAANYAPLGGAGASGTWGINITGNASTTSQRTFSNVKTDGATFGSYGSFGASGSNNGYSGISFSAASATLMLANDQSHFGFYKNNNTWVWGVDGSGVLTEGTVPWSRLTSIPGVGSFTNDVGYVTASSPSFSGTITGGAAVMSSNVRAGASPNGFVNLQVGDPAHSGYIEFYNAAGTRKGYIGYDSGGGILMVSDASQNFSTNVGFTIGGRIDHAAGGTGLRRIMATTTTGSPAGTAQGDLVLVY